MRLCILSRKDAAYVCLPGMHRLPPLPYPYDALEPVIGEH